MLKLHCDTQNLLLQDQRAALNAQIVLQDPRLHLYIDLALEIEVSDVQIAFGVNTA